VRAREQRERSVRRVAVPRLEDAERAPDHEVEGVGHERRHPVLDRAELDDGALAATVIMLGLKDRSAAVTFRVPRASPEPPIAPAPVPAVATAPAESALAGA
jgi:hypothetical protein